VVVAAIQTAATTNVTAGATAKKPAETKQQFDYMKLIVAQMQNMNPMDPNSGGDSLPTMMQAESLNQLTMLNQAVKDLQTMTQTSYASSLVGRTVTGVNDSNVTVTGTVRGLKMDAAGPVLELSTGARVRLLDITEVVNTTPATESSSTAAATSKP
jgi:flagellar basal-body rod modification protein FlgD